MFPVSYSQVMASSTSMGALWPPEITIFGLGECDGGHTPVALFLPRIRAVPPPPVSLEGLGVREYLYFVVRLATSV